MRVFVGVLCLSLLAPVAQATAPRPVRYQEKTAAAPASKKPFFKSRRGILIVSLSALAVGFTLWSKQEDRVHSPVR